MRAVKYAQTFWSKTGAFWKAVEKNGGENAHARRSCRWELTEPVSLTLQLLCDVARMGSAGWARGEARVADDSDFETLKTLLASEDGWTLEYEREGVKVWAEDVAHGALRTVKVCFAR